ncbi:hypothetical protein SEVIR_9G329501v4 [Setaria viridis]
MRCASVASAGLRGAPASLRSLFPSRSPSPMRVLFHSLVALPAPKRICALLSCFRLAFSLGIGSSYPLDRERSKSRRAASRRPKPAVPKGSYERGKPAGT